MVVRVIIASILSAVVLFVWGWLFWDVLPLGSAVLEEEPFGGEKLVSEISGTLANSGVYYLPTRPDPELVNEEQIEQFEERHRQGPLIRIFYNTKGTEPGARELLIKGFLHCLGIGLLMCIILAMAAPALPTFTSRFVLVFLTGGVAAVWLGLNEAIWFYHPLPYELYQAAYVLVGGLLMGVVMAAIVKVRTPQTTTAEATQGQTER